MVKRIGTIGGRAPVAREDRSVTKDGLVLAAIAIVSVAFGVGLYEQAGLNVVLSITLGAAGFFVLFSLHYIIVQLSSSESISPRISSLERVVARLARDMSQVEEMSKEIAEFRGTCERIDQAHSQLELGGYGESVQAREEAVRRLTLDVQRLDAQLRSLKDYFEISSQENKDRMKSELMAIESHVKHVTESLRLQSPDHFRDQSYASSGYQGNGNASAGMLSAPPIGGALAPPSFGGGSLNAPSLPPFQDMGNGARQGAVQNSSGGPLPATGGSFGSGLTLPGAVPAVAGQGGASLPPTDGFGADTMAGTPSPFPNLPSSLTPNYQDNSQTTDFEFKPMQTTPPPGSETSHAGQQDVHFTPQPFPPSEPPRTDHPAPFIPPLPDNNEGKSFFFQDLAPKENDSASGMLDILKKAISGNRIDLHLQPVVSLPERNVAYYESFTRIRDENDQVYTPSQYIGIAEANQIMPVIDNVMLFRSIQVARKLIERGSARGLFCNISSSSLMDNEFFTEFLGFLDKNKALASCLYFDIDQSAYGQPGKAGMEKLVALSKLGYQFSLDNVTRLDLDFGELQKQGVRFLKVDSNLLLTGMEAAGSRIHVADIRSYLKRYEIELIGSRVENEAVLGQLLTYNLKLGQGYLFSEPRPVRPEIFKGGSPQQAA